MAIFRYIPGIADGPCSDEVRSCDHTIHGSAAWIGRLIDDTGADAFSSA